MSVADVYDALRSDRCYRKGFPHEKVVGMIVEGKGAQFDPVIVEVFMELEERFAGMCYDDPVHPGYVGNPEGKN